MTVAARPELTNRQQQLLDYIEEYNGANGYPPSVRQMRDALGLQQASTAYQHLKRLVAKGYLRPTKHRGQVVYVPMPPEELLPQ